MTQLHLTPDQRLIITALTARSVMWRAWRGKLQYRVELPPDRATWHDCPSDYDRMVRRLDRL